MNDTETMRARCCIAGGGPAGMMLGYLLARAGVSVVVLEKHADFLRDFRGDTVHPSTLEVMHELGLLEDFLKRPHQEVRQLSGKINDELVQIADFSHLKLTCPFIALMPQWDFLNFLAEHAKALPGFRLMMETEATDLIETNGCVTGVKAKTPQGEVTIESALVVAADGRHSTLRERAGFKPRDLGAPIDVLWFRVSRRESDPEQTFGTFKAGRIMVTLNRNDYWQCAYVIPKGAAAAMRQKDITTLRNSVADIAPFLKDRVSEIKSWDDAKLLTVAVDRLKRWWKPGLLCIGDAAHAMSPIGGVGINLAIQDAVAAANILAEPLKRGGLSIKHLKALQRRRIWPVLLTQGLQVIIQKRVISKVLSSRHSLPMPFAIKLMQVLPVLTRIPARVVGVGFLPEHVRN